MKNYQPSSKFFFTWFYKSWSWILGPAVILRSLGTAFTIYIFLFTFKCGHTVWKGNVWVTFFLANYLLRPFSHSVYPSFFVCCCFNVKNSFPVWGESTLFCGIRNLICMHVSGLLLLGGNGRSLKTRDQFSLAKNPWRMSLQNLLLQHFTNL